MRSSILTAASVVFAFMVAALCPRSLFAAPSCGGAIPPPTPAGCASTTLALADSASNPPVGEDADFLFNKTNGGRPTVVFLLDTSENMRGLPIDVTSAAVRANGAGCKNILLNQLKYAANPCQDGMGMLLSPAPASCDTSPASKTYGFPVGWKLLYDPSYNYNPFDAATPSLFQASSYYLLDQGWAQSTDAVSTVNGINFTFPSGAAACAQAGGATPLTAAELADCKACLDGKAVAANPTQGGGYWLHPTRPGVVAFRGAWLNFFPPKYVMARRILTDQIKAMDAGGNSRQAIAVLASDALAGAKQFTCIGPTSDWAGNAPRHYESWLNWMGYDGTKMGGGWTYADPTRDGAMFISSNAQLDPPCSHFSSCASTGAGTGRPALYNDLKPVATNNWMFASPSGIGPNLDDASAATVTSGGVTGCPPVPGVRWMTGQDSVCRGIYDNTVTVNFTAWAWPYKLGSSFAASLNGSAVHCAPFGEALFNIGQYFTEGASTGGPVYDTRFPSWWPSTHNWRKVKGVGPGAALTDFDEGAGQNVSLCPPGSGGGGCDCPRPAVIMIAGGSPQFDDNIPWQIRSTAAACTTSGGSSSNLVKVAKYLAGIDLRPAETYSRKPVGLQTFAIDLGSSDPSLAAAAQAGSGQYFFVQDAKALRSAINEALLAISTNSVSFSNASVSAVQTTTSQGVLVPRFTPATGAIWEGHLYKFHLTAEFTNGCVPNKPGDLNQDGNCDQVFVTDKDGNVIVETKTGFEKGTLDLLTHQFNANGTPANPFWDAGQSLAARPADGPGGRKIFTVTDSNGDGAYDSRDQVIELSEANACKLIPYLNISSGPFCEELGSRLGVCLTVEGCAVQIIRFVRGRDIFNKTCANPFDPNNPPDRAFKLGDIFHSSPTMVNAPEKPEWCAFNNQCLGSLFAGPTPLDKDPVTKADAYELYRKAQEHRKRFVLVGANDGMLHSFDNGSWVAADNPATPTINECPNPLNCTGYWTEGTGEESWAFVPPDLLGKLQLMLGATHQYYVDATPLVRDIWNDDNKDLRKQSNEFRTVVVMGERRGGTTFFALDVTDPNGPNVAGLPAAGFFRWSFPEPVLDLKNRFWATLFGETYSDSTPLPPPIGPVGLLHSTGVKDTSGATRLRSGKKYEERWVTMLNGGYDQTQAKGNGFVMVDVWNGGNGKGGVAADSATPIWGEAWGAGLSAPIPGMDYSLAATAAMVGHGPNTLRIRPASVANEMLFDSMSIGDVGGQMWVARFYDPDPLKWAVGRSFTVSDVGGTCGTQPFYHIASSAYWPDNPAIEQDSYYVALGTGDRFNLRDTSGGECSASNLIGCVRRGCKVKQEIELEACAGESELERSYPGGGTGNSCAKADVQNQVASFKPNQCCTSQVEVETEMEMTCPGGVKFKWEPETKCDPRTVTHCGETVTGFTCRTTKDVPFDICSRFPGCNSTLAPPPPSNGFYVTKVFEQIPVPRPVFNTPTAGALNQPFDTVHLSGASPTVAKLNPYAVPLLPGFSGSANSGWLFGYSPNHVMPLGFSAINERTATPATITSVGGGGFVLCVGIATTTPSSAPGNCSVVSPSSTTAYFVDMTNGGRCVDPGTGKDVLAPVDSRIETVPPSPPQDVVFLSPQGTVTTALISFGRAAGSPMASATATGTTKEILKPISWMEVPRGLHACRHAATAAEAQQYCTVK